jgi:hypothetical protein
MKEFEHLMSVWQGQPATDKLSVDEALKQVKKGIRGITNKLYWSIVAMIALLLCFPVACYYRWHIDNFNHHAHVLVAYSEALSHFKQTRPYPKPNRLS